MRKNMNKCTHKKLIFIGKQEYPGRAAMPLYNCRHCKTTISKQTIKQINKKR